jgi:tRNA pseudouridine55 synthase
VSKAKRFSRDVDGMLLLDKPLGLSSNAALQQVRVLFRAAKAGHAGSLDPLATGMLPICLGQATKVCGRLLDSNKTYRVSIELGARTESLDYETDIVERAPIPALTDASVRDVLATFVGEQQQVPPMHSAVKHDGKRLYELARRGESVERQARRIMIHRCEFIALAPARLDAEVACSKGTYIRTLAADIAARLGTLGFVAMLRRVSVEPFQSYPMQTMEQLKSLTEGELDRLLIPSDAAFTDLGRVDLGELEMQSLFKGQTVQPVAAAAQTLQLRAYDASGRFLGLVEGQPDGRVRPVRLFVTVD